MAAGSSADAAVAAAASEAAEAAPGGAAPAQVEQASPPTAAAEASLGEAAPMEEDGWDSADCRCCRGAGCLRCLRLPRGDGRRADAPAEFSAPGDALFKEFTQGHAEVGAEEADPAEVAVEPAEADVEPAEVEPAVEKAEVEPAGVARAEEETADWDRDVDVSPAEVAPAEAERAEAEREGTSSARGRRRSRRGPPRGSAGLEQPRESAGLASPPAAAGSSSGHDGLGTPRYPRWRTAVVRTENKGGVAPGTPLVLNCGMQVDHDLADKATPAKVELASPPTKAVPAEGGAAWESRILLDGSLDSRRSA